MGERLVLIAFTAVAVSSLVFLGVHQLPGNAFLSDRRIDPAALEAILHHYHLDLPLFDQYKLFVAGILHGDLGESLVNRGTRITPLLLREATVSLEVGGVALLFTVGLGMILGVIAAIRQNTWVDYMATATSVIGYSVPTSSLPQPWCWFSPSTSITGPGGLSTTRWAGRAPMGSWARSSCPPSRSGSLTPASWPG